MVLQWNAGSFRARSTELLHFLSAHPVHLICIQESNLNSPSSYRMPGFSALRSDRTHSLSGILSPGARRASDVVVTIFVTQGLFSELYTSSLSSLDPYLDFVWVNVSLNNPPRSLFLMFMQISSLWGTLTAIILSGTQEVLSTFVGRKYSIRSSLLTSFCPMTLTHLLFSIAPLAVASLLTSPLLPPLLPHLAPGKCFRTWALITYQFY